MRNVISLVLGGGRGTRLYPLTKNRSKPAVPLAGKYRLIDIPLSNCINSGLNRIYVLTQFNSVSLHAHIRRTYSFDIFSEGWVEILAAQQTNESADWYQGTADAVRQNLRYLQQPGIDYVLILSGDQLYRMNFDEMIETHRKADAALTIAALPVERAETPALGLMKVADDGQITGFKEKPQTEEELKPVLVDPKWIDAQGIESRGRDCLASMGIYLFDRDVLLELLETTNYRDFGKEVFPAALENKKVQIHLFDGYWEDIGTISAFYKANLELTQPNPPFRLASAKAPIYSRARFLPPSRIQGATLKNSLIAEGCSIGEGSVIENSTIGLRCQIGRNVTIRNTIVMGVDFYETPEEQASNRESGLPNVGIADGTVIENAIIDKNCRIGQNVRVVNEQNIQDREETDESMICDGVVFINKNAVLPNGWKLN